MNRQDAFERVVDALNEAMLDDTLWLGTSARIEEACGTKGTMVTFGEELPNHTEFFFARMGFRGVDRSDWLDEYFRDFYADDEHLPRVRSLRAHRPPLQSPRRLPSAGSSGVDSPNLDATGLAVPTARGGLGSHARRTKGARPPPVRTGAMGIPPRVRSHPKSMP